MPVTGSHDASFQASTRPTAGCSMLPLRIGGRPGPPLPELRDCGNLKMKRPSGAHVSRDGPKHGGAVLIGEKHLEGVTGQHHEIEAAIEPDRPGIALDPLHALAARPLRGNVEHRGGRIDADHRAAGPLRQRRGKQSRAASEVEHRRAALGQVAAIVEILGPAVLEIVELRQIRIAVEPVRFHEPLSPSSSSCPSARPRGSRPWP